jgi:hypothetical protein
MKLTIPAVPPLLVGYDARQWQKWFAFWALPLDCKADIVDAYPALVIERNHPGVAPRVFFNPEVFDTQVPAEVVFKPWSTVRLAETYPLQKKPDSSEKYFLFVSLEPMNFAVLAYKYRYTVRPEVFYFDMDYKESLLDATTVMELLTFYAPY